MAQALEDVARGALDLGGAKDSALSAINAMIEAADAEGAAIDGSNDASIRLRDSVREVEEAHRASAQAILENGGTLEEAQTAWADGRQAVIDMLVAKVMDATAAATWADANLGSASEVQTAMAGVKAAIESIPEKRNILLTVDTSEATRGLNQWVQGANNTVVRVKVAADGASFDYGRINVSANAAGGYYSNGVKSFAAGGFEPGIYPYTPGGIHKFAEEDDEAYISMDPARRRASERVWVQAGQRMGFGSAPVSVQTLSLDGLGITGTLDLGNGLTGFVDGRIVQSQAASNRRIGGGVRTV